MFTRVSDTISDSLAVELLRLAKIDRDWVEITHLEYPTYRSRCKYQTWVRSLCTATDLLSMWAASVWLVDGPKVFRPSADQCSALEQVEVRLELREYAQPYPAMLVDLPATYAPFDSLLCFSTPDLFCGTLNSRDHHNDITTAICHDGKPMEAAINQFHDDCKEDAKVAAPAMRVGINSCLALANYGSTATYLYPKEVERDHRLGKEDTERGDRARRRLQAPISLVSFDRDVVLYHTERSTRGAGEPTGREVASHWRRGHWHTVAYGKGKTERRRMLYPPVLVRADKFVGEASDTKVTYHT